MLRKDWGHILSPIINLIKRSNLKNIERNNLLFMEIMLKMWKTFNKILGYISIATTLSITKKNDKKNNSDMITKQNN